MKELNTWLSIGVLVLFSTAGDVQISRAMKEVGDVAKLYRRAGIRRVLATVLGAGRLWMGIAFLTVAFFSLLYALSWEDVSLVGPAAASLTFVSNAVAAKLWLHERVDRRRWIAAMFVAAGVALAAV